MDTVDRASEWGIKAAGEPDWSAIKAFEEKIVDKLVKGVTGLVAQRKIDVVTGTAQLVNGPAVEVDGRRIEANHVVIATGSSPRLLPGLSLTDRIITSDQALWYDRIPSSAVVIGAGAVGLEFASLYRSFGADVTLLEALPRLAPLEDEEVSKEIARAYRKRGITTASGASVTSVIHANDAVEVAYEVGGKAQTVTADICLVAIGRGPVTEGLGLDDAGVSIHEKGFVNVDARAPDERRERLGRRRRRRHAPAARPRRLHRGLRGRRAHRGRERARDRLPEHPQGHVLHARDRERRTHGVPGA